VDFVVSVFRLINRRGYSLPAFNFGYQERDTGTEWRANCGGTRAYLVRYATRLDRDMDEQAAESHFMMRPVTGALLMSGFGLFQAEPAGRVMFTDVWGDVVHWTAYIDHPDPDVGAMPDADTEVLYGWIRTLWREVRSFPAPFRMWPLNRHPVTAYGHSTLTFVGPPLSRATALALFRGRWRAERGGDKPLLAADSLYFCGTDVYLREIDCHGPLRQFDVTLDENKITPVKAVDHVRLVG
jgi:hypothetical protein